ncbi:hypothetical protein GCM10011490_11410 [Pseudoclavibacter endophyticus]|uniref:Peptidoglycan DD-metalloendopeptidase family protein n=1 Tax=Pseudoclavibacter endophyticus TaxID=1778590 RepID=A0A6H9WJR1_9MICO|nr:peptidoglycan DD-metalloendopeptidase family protein [Pseudoclavibacter endophyticus]KAB1649433.1 peptidoglycan DD-metalloendopeptidase family protein [Pseudoclavibacter endophyticus]GGA62690.1 hypothetical protein GCM10011490_11410 [Pseudoclavibacter endophyticus]
MTATHAAPPLTRRQAREIERRTGKRPVAVAAPVTDHVALAADVRARIEVATATARDRVHLDATSARTTTLSFAAHLATVEEPGDRADGASASVPASFGGAPRERGSVKAPRPAALVRRVRRRRATFGAVAASVAAVASVAAAAPGLNLAPDVAQASLVSPDTASAEEQTGAIDTGVDQAGGTEGQTQTVPYAPAPEVAPNLNDYQVITVAGDGVESAAAAPTLAPQFFDPYPSGRMNEGYGTRGGAHNGIDMVGGGCGAELVAVTGGTVTFAGAQGGYGNHVELDLGDGTTISYSHLQPGGIGVSVGQVVQAGDHIGAVGTTGHSTGCHLHFEVKVNGSFIDPVPWLAERGITA